jgi:uncharacterized membrane protein HdeD (DUF308 family)
MARRTDVFGFSGLVMLVLGAVLFLTGSEERLSWVYWVVGPFLWFVGFAVFVGWLMWRSYTLPDEHRAHHVAGHKR